MENVQIKRGRLIPNRKSMRRTERLIDLRSTVVGKKGGRGGFGMRNELGKRWIFERENPN
jgi:hypothetical protein